MKKDSTRDLLTIFSDLVTVKFKKGTQSETSRGQWCLPCREKKRGKSNKKTAFFVGGNSTCRVHIRSHYLLYQQCCKEQEIPENHYTIPQAIWKEMEEEKRGSKGKKQAKIDWAFEKENGKRAFTCEGVLNAVAQLVACDDQVKWERS